MIRFISILSFLLLLSIHSAFAYEFKKIDNLYNLLEEKYVETLNIKNLSVKSISLLTEFDHNIRFYHNQAKAFLYIENRLISTFNLPQNDKVNDWKSFMNNVLSVAFEHSTVLSDQSKHFETTVLSVILQNLDKYSRLGNLNSNQVTFEVTLHENSLYIKLNSFLVGQADELKNIINQYHDIDGIILDLRDNHGGSFIEAIKITDLFLDDALITFCKEKNSQKQYYNSTKGDILGGKPIVILTNEKTASASEIIAAALREQGRATLIGTSTYGKGTIQYVQKENKQALYLTSGYFYTPSGKEIEKKGVSPQICTGVNNSCLYSDKTDPNKDIVLAVRFIKNHLI